MYNHCERLRGRCRERGAHPVAPAALHWGACPGPPLIIDQNPYECDVRERSTRMAPYIHPLFLLCAACGVLRSYLRGSSLCNTEVAEVAPAPCRLARRRAHAKLPSRQSDSRGCSSYPRRRACRLGSNTLLVASEVLPCQASAAASRRSRPNQDAARCGFRRAAPVGAQEHAGTSTAGVAPTRAVCERSRSHHGGRPTCRCFGTTMNRADLGVTKPSNSAQSVENSAHSMVASVASSPITTYLRREKHDRAKSKSAFYRGGAEVGRARVRRTERSSTSTDVTDCDRHHHRHLRRRAAQAPTPAALVV